MWGAWSEVVKEEGRAQRERNEGGDAGRERAWSEGGSAGGRESTVGDT